MPTYPTRHLEALRDFPHGQRSLASGDRFDASEIDADYYVLHKMAKMLPDGLPASDAKAATPAPRTTSVASAEPRVPKKVPAPAALTGVVTLADVNPAAAGATATTQADGSEASKARAGDA